MKYFGLKARSSKKDRYVEREDRRHTSETKTSTKRHFEHCRTKLANLFQEPVQIRKAAVLHPTDSYQEFMATIRPVKITRAHYELRDENNRPFINFYGELLYFSHPKQAFEVCLKLKERFSIEVFVVYGPANRKFNHGDRVPEPVTKVVKSK